MSSIKELELKLLQKIAFIVLEHCTDTDEVHEKLLKLKPDFDALMYECFKTGYLLTEKE